MVFLYYHRRLIYSLIYRLFVTHSNIRFGTTTKMSNLLLFYLPLLSEFVVGAVFLEML